MQGAAYLGYKLMSRSTDRVEVEHHGKLWTYDVLAVLEFNSDRKRMSIICRTPDGSLKLFCKGEGGQEGEEDGGREGCGR